MRHAVIRISAIALLLAMVVSSFYLPFGSVTANASGSPETVASLTQFNRRSAPNFDLNETRNLAGIRQATGEQLSAFENLKQATNASNAKIRWNEFGGSPDAIYDFASAPSTASPEDAARAFLASNSALFGVADVSTLRVFTNREALGGFMIRFQQTIGGIDVKDGGIGIVMNADKQVIMASGPHFRDVNVNTTPTLSVEQARSAADADLQQFQFSYPGQATQLLQAGLSLISEQAAAANNIEPKLGIYPTADGYKLVWKVAKFSTNPFGLYMVSVDAHTGEIIARKDFISFQQAPGQETADVFPKYPDITDELKNQGIISVCNGAPCGQQRVTLRKFHPSNRVSGLNGTLTGTHALVNNALATKQPFAQAALGTWHFRNNNPAGFEGRTNELDQFAEPAEHQDEINAFFFTTYLLEYVDHLHIGGDNGSFGGGGGRFPDDYPNKTNPLPATVHMPDVITPIGGGSYPPPTDPQFAQKVLGLDNAFALNLTSIIESVSGTKSPLVVNPTFYGHGFLFNDLALEGTVPYHEGMHAITSPIAGLEGEPEGGALNEGQADMWAFTITDNASLGDYVVNAHKYRQRFRDLGRNPDSVAYIRSANSTLKYGDIGTLTDRTTGQPVFEEHYDGEIYMSTMWEIREMFNRLYPTNTTFKRPRPSDGQALKAITKGTEFFERDFLGSMYILGTTAPDTMVKARDAMIVADQMLYSSDSTDADAPGKHRAMIEQIFAAHELGVGAREVSGGKATISTKVTEFVGNQVAPSVPTNVRLEAASPRSLRVSWNGVQGALAYEILKRPINARNVRYSNGKRDFNDGDDSTTGFRHVAFVGNQVSYEDKGAINQVFAPAGINDLFSHEYVVRAVAANSTGQLGFSNLSGATKANKAVQDLTAQVDSAISNITFANGVLAFDNKLTNTRGALSSDKTIYAPIKFEVSNISNPTVTVKNGDSGANGFLYNQTLALGATSNAKRLEFNDPMAQLFSFDAKITGNAFTSSTTGTGSQTGDGTGNPPAPVVFSIFRENKTGTLAGGDASGTTWGNPATKGITWDDVEVTTKSDALGLDATLSSLTAVDLDFELRTVDGQILARSAGATATERVSATVQPNTIYILRVLGFANGPTTFNIVSDQLLPNGSPNANAGTQTSGGGSTGGGTTSVARLIRFTVNPVTGSVTSQLLQ
ncbi:MAG: M36 family metallopeptidase [Pyrinomonadaceae bacterium]|nr:M36 family metallopeptidase [Pyrinomonadaceae bacterium]